MDGKELRKLVLDAKVKAEAARIVEAEAFRQALLAEIREMDDEQRRDG